MMKNKIIEILNEYRENVSNDSSIDNYVIEEMHFNELAEEIIEKLNTHNVVCDYSPFPQSLTADKKYKILARHKEVVVIIDDEGKLSIFNKCYFNT